MSEEVQEKESINIVVSNKYLITNDKYNFIVKKKKKWKGKEVWTDEKYFSTVGLAANYILRDYRKTSSASTLQELIDAEKEIVTAINESLGAEYELRKKS